MSKLGYKKMQIDKTFRFSVKMDTEPLLTERCRCPHVGNHCLLILGVVIECVMKLNALHMFMWSFLLTYYFHVNPIYDDFTRPDYHFKGVAT